MTTTLPKRQPETVKLLKFTSRGHVMELATVHHDFGSSKSHVSGYETPESFPKPYHWWSNPPGKMSDHFSQYNWPADGVPVLDIREAVETDAGYKWVFRGPLLNVDLEDGDIDRLPDVSPFMAPAIAAYGQAAALVETVACRNTSKAGPLDGVSVAEYVRGWREHGAKVGKAFVRNGTFVIEWE